MLKGNKFHFAEKDKADIFRETFFTGKHLEKLSFNEEFKLHVENTFQQSLHSERPELESDRWFNSDFTSEELDYILRFLKTSGKSLDNDNIHPKMIKYAGPRYKEVLLHIANKTLNENHWPWNHSKVIFLRKQGKTDYTTPSAYRPITISSYIGKIVERLLDARLRSFFKKFNLLDEEQEGFQSHKSTVRSLYRLKMECQEVKKSRKSGALISIDFEKAFDSVWINGLLQKLYQSGVRGKFIKLIGSILKSRQLSIEIGNLRSQYFGVEDGLPQGSVLSPILFIFFVSDMFKNLNCKKFKFADDGNLLVTGYTETQVYLNCQVILKQLERWCKNWRLAVNGDKTSIIYLNTEYPHAPTFFGEACKVTRSTKILGLIVDDKLNFNEHLQQVEGKVAKQLNIFKKFCGSNWGLRQATLIKLYKTLVLPRLLYAAPVWARKHVQALSRFQYTALKLIIGTSTKFDQLAAEILCGLPPMQLQIDIITIKFGIKLSQQQDILWKLYQKCQLPEIKSDKNLIDDFYKVTGAINCYTVSTCNEYLRSRWNRIFKNALTTTPLDWSITQIELEGIAYPKTTSRHLERTINKLLLNCNVELAEYAYKIWRAETPLCPCRVEAESVTHYLFFCPLYEQFRAPDFAAGNIYSLTWTTNLKNFIIDSGRFERSTERKRHFQESTRLLKTHNF